MPCWRTYGSHRRDGPRRKPTGAGIRSRSWGGSARRNRNKMPGTSPVARTLATMSEVLSGAIAATMSIAACAAFFLRRNQRTAPHKPISGPRSISAADSRLRAEIASVTTSLIVASNPGIRAARKSGSKLNVMWP